MILTTAKEIGIMADYENNLNNTETTSGGAPQPNTNAQVQPASEPKPEQINEPAQGAQSAPSYAEPQGQSYTTSPQEDTYYAPQANQAPQGNYNQPGYQAPPQQAYYAPQNGAQVPPYGCRSSPLNKKQALALPFFPFSFRLPAL